MEPVWPPALAVAVFILISLILRIVVPQRESIGPPWLIPITEFILLIVLLVAHQAGGDVRRPWMRPLSLVLIFALLLAGLSSTVRLTYDLITGSSLTNSADSLLAEGTLVWLGNALVFGLLYWQLDSGGPHARRVRKVQYPDFAFPQHMNPELAPPDWKPQYVDYFSLGMSTSLAFSATDAMPLAPWAKLAMTSQALISVTVLGLVIARAVNVFT
jgi:hypothetical protein